MSIGRNQIVPLNDSASDNNTSNNESTAQNQTLDNQLVVEEESSDNQSDAQSQMSEQQPAENQETTSQTQNFWLKFHYFHVKHTRKDISLELIVFRSVSLVLWLACTLIDTVAYSSALDTFLAKLFFGLKAPLYDVAAVLYASGSAAFGVGYEIYLLLPFAILNLILTLCNCDRRQKIIAILWLIKTVCLLVAAQVCYYNFRMIDKYKENFLKATSYMMRHALIFAVTMLFLMAPGLQAVYDSVTGQCPYTIARCNVIELYEPRFNRTCYCEYSYTQYIVGREELRILRNFLLIHIASYAIYNQSFLALHWEWSDKKMIFHYFARLSLLLIFICMSISVIIANMTPFEYPKQEIKLVFDIIEFFIFIIGLLMLISNYVSEKLRYPTVGEMNTTPDIIIFG